jgi:SAM-dependent methyltransferase
MSTNGKYAPSVMLAMPGYGELTAGAARGFWRATRRPDDQVYYAYREGSLLAANFNSLWCDALNLGPERFAMQHADIEPEDYWLDTLDEERERLGLDILGVHVPIKDNRGVTSTALARPDGDNWRPLCRLSMTDIHRMPETFTSEDIGHPILLNTGLWVCRFDPAWARKVRFTINDRIIIDQATGKYAAQCEPEDWYFSRLLHELGLKIGVTRKIKLTHRGPYKFVNDRAWGESFDSAWIDKSPVPESTPDVFVFPDITGWLRYEEGRELARLATGKRVLEIGSYYGLSTACLARTAYHVTAVDWWDGRGTMHQQQTDGEFIRNMTRLGLTDRVTMAFPTDDLATLGGYDFAFIDGAHDRASVESDIANVLPLLAPGGLIAFHDYRSVDPGVTEAVDSLIASGGELLSLTESLAVVRPPATILQEV